MDEVQMLDARSASKAAQMVTSLQRVNSLVLSGTPAKQAVQDLQSALHFVGVNIHHSVWNRFLKPGFRHAFRDLFGEVAIRHTKKMVKNETDIPPQTRTLVPIKMNIVELQYYRDTLYRNIDALAVSKNGYRDTESLRSLVQTLRAVCTHIQTNELENGVRVERTRMGRENGAVLKDMDQALNTMYVYYVVHWRNTADESRGGLANLQASASMERLSPPHLCSTIHSNQICARPSLGPTRSIPQIDRPAPAS
jgi:E3 ubiquitin-protein ligase SHPRH